MLLLQNWRVANDWAWQLWGGRRYSLPPPELRHWGDSRVFGVAIGKIENQVEKCSFCFPQLDIGNSGSHSKEVQVQRTDSRLSCSRRQNGRRPTQAAAAFLRTYLDGFCRKNGWRPACLPMRALMPFQFFPTKSSIIYWNINFLGYNTAFLLAVHHYVSAILFGPLRDEMQIRKTTTKLLHNYNYQYSKGIVTWRSSW